MRDKIRERIGRTDKFKLKLKLKLRFEE